ncbi:restriction endonuclease subunit S [Helicobacter heilmannii]|uniref:restriction endonuclease subunit S n=1 Tax=Helicobacter heilmannii TaxID=35817 RepID=UPI0006B371E6|nr:restriction endonuclease subunit S [Helicobacter heilmannii]
MKTTVGLLTFTLSLEVYGCEGHDFDVEVLIIGDWGSANIHYAKGKFASSDHNYVFEGIAPLCLKHAYLILRYHLELSRFNGIVLKNIAKNSLMGIEISLPPLEVQEQIITECVAVKKRTQELQTASKNYQALILSVLEVCGMAKTTKSSPPLNKSYKP